MASIGVNVGLQSLLASLGLASAALVLARDRIWKLSDAVEITAGGDLQQIRNLNTSIFDQQGQWFGAWVELGMAWYIGFASIWLLSVVLLALTFKWPIPLLVVPNIALMVLGTLVNAIAFGGILAWLIELPRAFRTEGHEQKMFVLIDGLFLLIAVLSFVCIALSVSHYQMLQKFIRSNTRVSAMATPASTSSPVDRQRTEDSKRTVLDVWASSAKK